MSAPYLTPLFSDSFQRANVSPLAFPWVVDEHGDNGLQIVSDLCESASGANSFGVQFYLASLSPTYDEYVSATLGASLPNAAALNLMARTTDGGTVFSPGSWPGYTLQIYSFFGSTSWNFYCSTGGLIASGPLTVNNGDTFTLALVGTTVYLLQNSTLLTSFTNTAISSGGIALACATNSSNSVQISNWVAGSAALDPIYAVIDTLFSGLNSIARQIVHDCCVGYFLTHGSSDQIPAGWSGTTAPNVPQIVALVLSLTRFGLEPPGA